MSTRPYSWFPLAASDPVPGDPDAVQRAADRYREVAEHIGVAADSLRRVHSSPGMEANSVDAIRDKAKTVREEVDLAKGRYGAIADALATYAGALRAAQDAADALLAQAVATQHAIDNATTERTRATTAWWDLDADTDEHERRTAWNRLATARTTVNDSEIRLQHLRDDLELVVRDRDTAAQRAIDGIGAAVGADGLDDGWWEDWGADLARSISDIAGVVATVAGIVALVLGWVPILGQVLAGVAVAAGIVALVADIALSATGEQDWTNVVIGGIGLLTFGAGRLIARGTVALAQTGRASAGAAVRALGRSGNPATRASASAVRPASLRTPPRVDLRIRDLFHAGSDAGRVYASAWRAATQQLRATSGAQRYLALAGHGNLVTDASALAAMQSTLARPQVAALLTEPMQVARGLQIGSALVYLTDATTSYAAVASDVVEKQRPAPTAAERLGL